MSLRVLRNNKNIKEIKMKRILFILTLIGLLSVNLFGQVIPKQISYQGVLKDANGDLVNGDQAITFKIYNEPTGGTALWTEIQVTTVTNGLFNTHLGSVTPIAGVPFDRVHFLGITIGTAAELSPRTMLTPSPYSFMSIDVMDEAITTAKIHDGAVTGDKIGSNQVVKSLNGIKDDVTLVGGTNITLTPSGNNITINAEGIGGGTVTQVNTGAGLTGGPITTTGTISVPNDGITGAMLQNNSVTSAKIVDGTIVTADLANNSVTSEKIVDGTITGPDIANSTIGAEKLSFTPGTGTIGGSGTANYIPKFTANTTLGNSAIYQSGDNVGIGTSNPLDVLHVVRSSVDLEGMLCYSRSNPYPIFGGFRAGTAGISTNSRGFLGSYSYGIINQMNRYGVYGTADLASGGNSYGIYGSATGLTTNYGIYATATGGTTNWSGWFLGNMRVVGIINPSAIESVIDHPLDPANKYLYHAVVESPDMKNIYDGNVVTDGSGYATVTLPEWFEALNKDLRYQLTVIGDFAQAIIAQKVQRNQFSIRTDKPNVEVSWQVTGIRKDAFAEKNRKPVEVTKQGNEVGKYIHPDAFGLPESMGIDYEKNNPER